MTQTAAGVAASAVGAAAAAAGGEAGAAAEAGVYKSFFKDWDQHAVVGAGVIDASRRNNRSTLLVQMS